MSNYLLSIMICSVPERIPDLNKLMKSLEKQYSEQIQILYLGDSRSMTTGEKRNWLLKMATGKYVCFVDDDDNVNSKYVEYILDAIEQNPDVVCFNVCKKDHTKKGCEVLFSADYDENKRVGNVFYRMPNHIMVFKRSIAIKEKFPHITIGEDSRWAKKVYKYIKTHVIINKVLYIYENNFIKKSQRIPFGRRYRKG